MSGQFTGKRQTETINRTPWLRLGASTLAILFPLAKTLAVGALAVPVVGMIGSTAKADTAACNALGSSSYVANSNGNFSLNSFQTFNLDNGTGIGFSANVPAGATVRITYAGQTVTLDNSSGTAAQTLSGSITVSESRGFSNSAVIIAVSGLITGGSTTINFDCTEPSTGGGTNNANTGSTAAPAVAPVATPVSIVPPINPQYGAVADGGVEALLTGVPGFGSRLFPFNNFLNSPAVAAKKTCNDWAIEIIDAGNVLAELPAFGFSIESSKQLAADEIKFQKVFDDAKQAFKDAGCDEQISAPAGPGGAFGPSPSLPSGSNDSTTATSEEAAKKTCNDLAIKIIDAGNILAELPAFGFSIESSKQLAADEIKFQKVFDDAKQAFKNAGCIEAGASSNYVPHRNSPPSVVAINEATGPTSLNTPYTYSANLTPGAGGGIIGKFALSNLKAKRPWVLFFNSGVSGLDDNRTGADRRSRVWAFSAGGSIQWNPKTSFGITGGYSQGVVKSKANSSKLTGDYFSVTISGDRKLMKALSLGISAGYTHGENTLAIGGGTGDFGVDVFNASASLSGAFKWQDFTIAPSLSAGISRVNRDGYTDSLGIIVPGSEKTHGNVNFGTSISKTFRFVDGFKSITPSVSLGGGYFFREKFDATLTSGTVAKQLGFGANLATGLDLRMDNGIGINFGGSYGLFQNDIQIWSLNAKLSKVF